MRPPQQQYGQVVSAIDSTHSVLPERLPREPSRIPSAALVKCAPLETTTQKNLPGRGGHSSVWLRESRLSSPCGSGGRQHHGGGECVAGDVRATVCFEKCLDRGVGRDNGFCMRGGHVSDDRVSAGTGRMTRSRRENLSWARQ